MQQAARDAAYRLVNRSEEGVDAAGGTKIDNRTRRTRAFRKFVAARTDLADPDVDVTTQVEASSRTSQ